MVAALNMKGYSVTRRGMKALPKTSPFYNSIIYHSATFIKDFSKEHLL